MTIKPTRIEAKKNLTYFIEEKLINYSKLRNFNIDIHTLLTEFLVKMKLLENL